MNNKMGLRQKLYEFWFFKDSQNSVNFRSNSLKGQTIDLCYFILFKKICIFYWHGGDPPPPNLSRCVL